MPQNEEMKRLIASVKAAHVAGSFPAYLEYIRFPKYKNLVPGSRIDFEFPFTVFTGLNGTGKSSALHAIFGTPKGNSTGNYWFSTDVDPIEEKDASAPHCFVYGYKDRARGIVEVLKTRINSKTEGPDYWESSRPIARYDMDTKAVPAGTTRNPPLDKEVVYLDFRAELSAFDKYFYFGDFSKTNTLKTKQDVLRKYSKYLKTAIDTNDVVSFRTNRRNKKPIALTASELRDVSKILGKSYDECLLLEHNFFGGAEGLTAYFKTESINYSEAYAGRGEFAIIKLIYEVGRAPVNSLIILDEPEVSLHPGAQVELKNFLLRAVLSKKLQVVISTHSPTFVENLPDEAIKLFLSDEAGKFFVKNSCNYREAFQSLGIEITDDDKYPITVEDRTAKLIIEKVMAELGPDYELLFSVRYYAGGAEMMYKTAAFHSQEGGKAKFWILDGDKNKPTFDTKLFAVKDADELKFISEKVKDSTGIALDKLPFRIDGNASGGNKEQLKLAAKNYLDFVHANFGYLPGLIPEETIWDADFVAKYLNALDITPPTFGEDYKENVLLFAELSFGDRTEESNASAKKLLVREMVKTKGKPYQELAAVLTQFKALVEA